MIPAGDIADLRDAFRVNPHDIGIGLYNPTTGEIRLGSFDAVSNRQGHQGLADAVGIADNDDWRGFIVGADKRLIPVSHFNLVDGALTMRPDHEAALRQELRQAGLIL